MSATFAEGLLGFMIAGAFPFPPCGVGGHTPMAETQYTPDQMRAMAQRIERAAEPNADASEYKDTAAMLRQGADAIEVAASLELALEEERHRPD